MKIVISTPEMLLSERAKIVKQAMEMMQKQKRSNERYSKKMSALLNRLCRLEEQLTGK